MMTAVILRPVLPFTFAALLGVLVVSATPALANPIVQLHLDLQELVPGEGGIPGDGSVWHDMWLEYCTTWTQVAYDDRDGDHEVSLDDWITLRWPDYVGDTVFRVMWHGLAYFTVCLPPGGGPSYDAAFCPAGVPCIWPGQSHDPVDPVGETWYELHPSICDPMLVDEWIDHNSSGVLDEGDEIRHDVPDDGLGPFVYSISRVAVSIDVVSPAIGVGTSTWGTLKASYSETPGSSD